MRFRTPSRLVPVLAVIATLVVLAIVQPWSLGPSRLPTRSVPLVSMFEDIDGLYAYPKQTLQVLRSLGVQVLRVPLQWGGVAEQPTSRTQPAGDPYPDARWALFDTIDREAHADGIRINFLVTGGAPLWASAPGKITRNTPPGVLDPSASAYGQFVQAAGRRYSGSYTPPGSSSSLPRVDFWEIWNEPNWGPSLQPQLATNPLRIASAQEYRLLLDAAWRALDQTGHRHDTIVIGNLSPRGTSVQPGAPLPAAAYTVASPLGFTRALYCVDSSYHPLSGKAATEVGCPTAASGAKAFRAAHPALFGAPGFGIHPYPINLPPTEADTNNPDTVEFSQIPHLVTALDQAQGTYGTHTQMSVYNTEYGYITHPPNAGVGYLSPARAGAYLNWTEYLEWRNSRIASSAQYLLYDPPPGQSNYGVGGFASGLVAEGKPEANFYAYRMPIWMPLTHTSKGRGLEVWGCARPAPPAYTDTHQPQDVQIQLGRDANGPFSTVKTIRLNPQRGCYFDVRVKFPASGTVRLQWTYPPSDQRLADPLVPGEGAIYSRSVSVRIG